MFVQFLREDGHEVTIHMANDLTNLPISDLPILELTHDQAMQLEAAVDHMDSRLYV